MTLQTSDYTGDEVYTINCTGDCVVGDEVSFERATFTGNFRNAKFDGFELTQGKIVNDSYGRDKQQHTFTILLEAGRTVKKLPAKLMTIKGRNLYANGTYRKLWADESQRGLAADEKHVRGDKARAARDYRKMGGI
jgi:hypothetical protein